MGTRPRRALLVVGAVIVALLLVGFTAEYVTTQPSFCNWCHEMGVHYQTWQASAHGPVAGCLDCHRDPTVLGFLEEKVSAAQELVVHFRGDYETPIRALNRVPDSRCLKCHLQPPSPEAEGRTVNHELHRERQVLCVECHDRVAHPGDDQASVATNADCEGCHHFHDEFLVLSGVHGQADCAQCHPSDDFAAASPDCQSCHQPPAEGHPGADAYCQLCHSPEGWQAVVAFDHQDTGFLLVGQHEQTACAECHGRPFVSPRSALCETCHVAPAAAHTGLDSGCEGCHTPLAWAQVSYDHSVTGFTLVGLHQDLACQSCHGDAGPGPLPTQCVACHQAPTADHTSPGQRCEDCHTPAGWGDLATDHDRTDFPLVGQHIGVPCASCHGTPFALPASMLCESCHEPPTADHPGQGAGCESCHSPTGWDQITFDHSQTDFALLGLHQAVACRACHGSPFATPADTACQSCHASPESHAWFAAGACLPCHSPAGWTQVALDHSQTAFPLTGAHATQICRACHTTGISAPAGTICQACHQPPTLHQGPAADCAGCHGTGAWQPVSFDHAGTGFALDGLHQGVSCQACHGIPFSVPASSACEACHQAPASGHPGPNSACGRCHCTGGWKPAQVDHDATRFPLVGRHVSLGCASCHGEPFGAAAGTACESCHQAPAAHPGPNSGCQQCHSQDTWQGATIDHNATAFPLVGRHASLGCVSCHGDPFGAAAGTACESCHQAPAAHPGPNANCQQCHNQDGWKGATIDHNATGFPLVGRHASLGCVSCHGDPFGAAAGTACESCHQAPSAHPGPNSGCQQCHSQDGWKGATIDHNATAFPLVGVHANLGCASCHGEPFGAAAGTACQSCHQPPGSHAGIAASCQDCHAPTGWLPANFSHSRVGEHVPGGERSLSCNTCHRSGTFTAHDCTGAGCHSSNDPGGEDGGEDDDDD